MSDLARAHAEIRADAARLAGGPGDMPQRVALLHAIFVDSGGNHAFPEVALHGALWAYGFYERRGTISRMIGYRYFYDADERARRSYMLFEFSQGFKEANRSVFIDTYTNFVFSKRLGEEPGAEEILAPELLEALNRVHRAARDRRQLPRGVRAYLGVRALQVGHTPRAYGASAHRGRLARGGPVVPAGFSGSAAWGWRSPCRRRAPRRRRAGSRARWA